MLGIRVWGSFENSFKGTHFRVRVQLRDEVTALTTRVQQLEADLTRERLARKGGGGKK